MNIPEAAAPALGAAAAQQAQPTHAQPSEGAVSTAPGGAAAPDFAAALSRAEMAAAPPGVDPADAVTPAMRSVFSSLQRLDNEASGLVDDAKAAAAAGPDLTPGEMTMLTLRAHEFMFHAQLTSNVANRTSDGLQQLFRQQA